MDVNSDIPAPPGADINKNETQVFETYDDGFIVRAMRPDEAKIVQKWYCGMGMISQWDLDTALAVFPPGRGFYIGEYEGEVVASAIRIPWGNGVYYGSYYYVDGKYRGRGFGTRLRDQVAFGHVGKNTLCVDAVLGKVTTDNENKYHYTYRFKMGRYSGLAKEDFGVKYDGVLKKASEVDFQQVIDYDNKCFVSKDNPQRRALLERWLGARDGGAWVALDPRGEIVGLGLRRPCIQEGNAMIGPLYADTPQVAEAILQQLCSEVAGLQFTINIWVPNEDSMKMVDKFGATKVFECNRMHVNGDANEYKTTTYALTSIDICGF